MLCGGFIAVRQSTLTSRCRINYDQCTQPQLNSVVVVYCHKRSKPFVLYRPELEISMSQLVVRNTTTPPFNGAESFFATSEERRMYGLWHDRIALPAAGIIDAAYQLMSRIQENLRTSVPFTIVDSCMYYSFTMQWQNAGNPDRLQLVLTGDRHGFWVRLQPFFGSRVDSGDARDLVHWRCTREIHGGYSFGARYGDLCVYRGEQAWVGYKTFFYREVNGRRMYSIYTTTPLVFDHPVFEGVPREEDKPPYWWQSQPKAAELGADIIHTTQSYIDAADLS